MAKKKKTKEELEYHVLLENVRALLKSRAGKDVIWNILTFCDLYGDLFTGNSQTFYLEGKRSVGLYVLQLLEDADPTAYARLLLDKQNIGVSEDGRAESDTGADTYTASGTG